MLLDRLDRRTATFVRLVGAGPHRWSVVNAERHPRRSAVAVWSSACSLAAAVIAWLVLDGPAHQRTGHAGPLRDGRRRRPAHRSVAEQRRQRVRVRCRRRRRRARGARRGCAGGRRRHPRARHLGASSTSKRGLGLLAYSLGFSAGLLAASGRRQSVERAEQAELLLAQTQRSHEEQLRAARLEESTRIARDIHDVLAHALAGLTIQLEATSALIEQGADRDRILARVQRAHELAREGLRETRRAVGALRGDAVAAPPASRRWSPTTAPPATRRSSSRSTATGTGWPARPARSCSASSRRR